MSTPSYYYDNGKQIYTAPKNTSTGSSSSTSADSIYANTSVPSGNTVSAIGNGAANVQKAFATGPTIPANYFSLGTEIIIEGWGYYTATVGVNVQPEVWAGGTSGIKLIDASALGLPSTVANSRYDFKIWLKCLQTGVNGILESFGKLTFMNPAANAAGGVAYLVGPNGASDGSQCTVNYDTTVSKIIQLTAAYSSSTSSDTNTLRSIKARGYKLAS